MYGYSHGELWLYIILNDVRVCYDFLLKPCECVKPLLTRQWPNGLRVLYDILHAFFYIDGCHAITPLWEFSGSLLALFIYVSRFHLTSYISLIFILFFLVNSVQNKQSSSIQRTNDPMGSRGVYPSYTRGHWPSGCYCHHRRSRRSFLATYIIAWNPCIQWKKNFI